jgi:Fe-S-cluster containining protein
VTEAEIRALASAVDLSEEELRRRCLKKVGRRFSIRERANGDCIFLRRGTGCVVYAVRPTQCRTFPFWPEHLDAPESWEEAARDCPGMNRGKRHSLEEIQAKLNEEQKGAGS